MSSRPTDDRRPLRLARGAVVGLVGGVVSVGGHAVGGGAVPGPAAWTAVALVVVAAVIASSRRWTPARLLLALGGAQALVHAALWLAVPTSSADPRLAGIGLVGAHAQAAPAGHEHTTAVDLRMLVAHLAATTVAVLLLAVLDRCALAVWAALHAVRTSRGRLVLPAPPHVAVGRGACAQGTGLVVVRRRPRRGPPALLAPG